MLKARMNQQTEVNMGRRNFLGTVKYMAAISVVALAGKNPASRAATSATSPLEQPASGYRETGHIRNYYDSARY